MRFHALGIPHTITRKDFLTCAYTQKVLKFCKMMTDLGHEVIHYGGEKSEVQCTEHVNVCDDKFFQMTYGKRDPNDFYEWKNDDLPYIIFNETACRELEKRKQPDDFLLAFFGYGHWPIVERNLDMLIVEPGIGYPYNHFANYKVFESYALMHALLGAEGVAKCESTTPRNVVIPNYFDEEDFEFKSKKLDYFLYLGRVIDAKGIDLIIDATAEAGVQLVIAGQFDNDIELPDHCRYMGVANAGQRKGLLADAKALIIATKYVEPFGGVQVEALLSGTPTITPDYGAFVENNHNGLTGYRCRTYNDYVNAIRSIDTIDNKICRAYGEQFLLPQVGKRYENYFESILNGQTGKEYASRAHRG